MSGAAAARAAPPRVRARAAGARALPALEARENAGESSGGSVSVSRCLLLFPPPAAAAAPLRGTKASTASRSTQPQVAGSTQETRVMPVAAARARAAVEAVGLVG